MVNTKIRRIFGNLTIGSLAFALLAILVVDILNIQIYPCAIIGLVAWATIHLVITTYALSDLIALFIRPRTFGTSIVICVLVFLFIGIFWSVSDFRVLSQEGAVELRCIQDLTLSDPALGFWKTCLFGYPARQTYLHYLPTLFSGPSLVALNVGGLLYLVIGMLIFVGGIRSYIQLKKGQDVCLALALATVFHFYYFNETSFRPNMAIFPIGLSFLSIGLYFRFISKASWQNFLLLFSSLIIALYSYTPDLAIFCAGLMIFSLYAITNAYTDKIPRWVYVCSVVLLLGCFARSLEYRYDIRLFSDQSEHGGDGAFKALKESLNFIVSRDSFVTLAAQVGFVIATLYGVLLIRSAQIFFLFSFIVGIIVAASITKGYNFLGLDLRLHRASVAIPAIVTLYFLVLQDFTKRIEVTKARNVFNPIILFLTATMLWAGVEYRVAFLDSKILHPHLIFFNKLTEIYPGFLQADRAAVYLSTDSSPALASVSDSIKYFYPDKLVERLNDNCELQDKPEDITLAVIVINGNSKCDQKGIFQKYCDSSGIKEFQLNHENIKICTKSNPTK